eukprot:31378-Pelagococcus_subviridis.AAC.7
MIPPHRCYASARSISCSRGDRDRVPRQEVVAREVLKPRRPRPAAAAAAAAAAASLAPAENAVLPHDRVRIVHGGADVHVLVLVHAQLRPHLRVELFLVHINPGGYARPHPRDGFFPGGGGGVARLLAGRGRPRERIRVRRRRDRRSRRVRVDLGRVEPGEEAALLRDGVGGGDVKREKLGRVGGVAEHPSSAHLDVKLRGPQRRGDLSRGYPGFVRLDRARCERAQADRVRREDGDVGRQEARRERSRRRARRDAPLQRHLGALRVVVVFVTVVAVVTGVFYAFLCVAVAVLRRPRVFRVRVLHVFALRRLGVGFVVCGADDPAHRRQPDVRAHQQHGRRLARRRARGAALPPSPADALLRGGDVVDGVVVAGFARLNREQPLHLHALQVEPRVALRERRADVLEQPVRFSVFLEVFHRAPVDAAARGRPAQLEERHRAHAVVR